MRFLTLWWLVAVACALHLAPGWVVAGIVVLPIVAILVAAVTP